MAIARCPKCGHLFGLSCTRCGHEWVPDEEGYEPKVCPKCKSPYWNKPRVRGVKAKAGLPPSASSQKGGRPRHATGG